MNIPGTETTQSANDFFIRPLLREDVPALLQLIRELAAFEKMPSRVTATEERLERTLFDTPFAEGFWGMVGDEVAAYAIIHHTYSTFAGLPGLYLEDIYVREAYRGRGYGKRMMRHLAKLAVARGCKSMSWSVLDWNRQAIDFYVALGAGKYDEWDSYRIDGERLNMLADAEA